MNTDTRRQVTARLLLTIYLMILSASVLHVHHHADHADDPVVCQDCLHHVQHSGHVGTNTVPSDTCLVCEFLSVTYLAAQTLDIEDAVFLFFDTLKDCIHQVPICFCENPCGRAPPFIGFSHQA